MSNNLRIGIMGGTFDPIHCGHLIVAETAREQHALDQVIFIPTGNPPHKTQGPSASGEHRYVMTQLATADHAMFRVSRMEMERPGFSYTYDTLIALEEQYPRATFYVIVGADELLELSTWHCIEKLIKECCFIAAKRPGYDLRPLEELLSAEFSHKILFLSIPAMDISATDIRRRLGKNESIKYLVPKDVEAYIQKNHLYSASQGSEAICRK